MGFLGVYKAIYDYAPQSDNELAIKEGDVLYILEKSGEDDWWKAKKKAMGDEDEEPTGLIPNNYVEELQPTYHARALYDYTRQTDEELSFSEDSRLQVYDTSDPDWILVGLDNEYGFAPANYIEMQAEGSLAQPATPQTPSLPQRPALPERISQSSTDLVSPQSPVQQGPAAALAGIINQRKSSGTRNVQYTPEASDEEETLSPALPARPNSQSRPAPVDTQNPRDLYGAQLDSPVIGGSPSYNRALDSGMDGDAARHSPGGFHMYNINEMVSVMGKRKKMPTTLGINIATGVIMIAPEKSKDGPELKWTAEKMTHYSIEGKHIFMELVKPSKSVDFHAGAKDTAQEIVAALGELAGAVRAEGLREVILAGSGQEQKKGQVLYDFMAQGDDEVTVAVGDEVVIIDDLKSEEWWQVRRLRNGKEGVVPSSYIEITGTIQAPSRTGVNAGKSTVEQNRLEEERLAKESLRAARREEERGSEVGPGMRLPERGSSLAAKDSGNISPQQKSRRDSSRPQDSSTQSKSGKSKPDPSKVRTWTDRSKSFSVEAQFLALKDGKINLHKMNGVKIAVPVQKMSVEDLEYVERITGVSLDEDKPLSDIRKKQQRTKDSAPSGVAGASLERPKRPEYDWFQFFLSCDVAVGLCERYAQAFVKDSMDESVLPDIDAAVLRNLGIREGDIIKCMRFLDKKFGRSGKRNITFNGDDVGGDVDSGTGLFSGPGGALRNNTRKGRPAPTIQTNDVVDAKAFSQEPKEKVVSEGTATPLASVPAPIEKDVKRPGFDDDAWDVKPTKQASQLTSNQSSQQTPAQPGVSSKPALTGGMEELSLLSQPLEPIKVQPTAPLQLTPQVQPQTSQGPPPVTPSIFAGIGGQQTGLPAQQTGQVGTQFGTQIGPQFNGNRQRPQPPQLQNQAVSLGIPAPPNRPLSAPQVQQSAFSVPPLQAQMTGMQTSTGFHSQVAPLGQSLDELRLRQYTGYNNGLQNGHVMGILGAGQGFNTQPANSVPQNGFQYPMQTGVTQHILPPQQLPQQIAQPTGFLNNGGGPFSDHRAHQFSPMQAQPTGFQSSFSSPQQYPQPTGVNSFLQPALQPQQTGLQQQQQQQNGIQSNFVAPPIPPIPQQSTIAAPLIPQKTGPPPPVRFGLSAESKKILPQPTGRRANLAQATPQNPFGF